MLLGNLWKQGTNFFWYQLEPNLIVWGCSFHDEHQLNAPNGPRQRFGWLGALDCFRQGLKHMAGRALFCGGRVLCGLPYRQEKDRQAAPGHRSGWHRCIGCEPLGPCDGHGQRHDSPPPQSPLPHRLSWCGTWRGCSSSGCKPWSRCARPSGCTWVWPLRAARPPGNQVVHARDAPWNRRLQFEERPHHGCQPGPGRGKCNLRPHGPSPLAPP